MTTTPGHQTRRVLQGRLHRPATARSPFKSRSPSNDFVRAVDSSIPPLRTQWVREYGEEARKPRAGKGTEPEAYKDALVQLALESEHFEVRVQALDSISDPDSLCHIAAQSRHEQIRAKARAKLTGTITDSDTLNDLEERSRYPEVRAIARVQMVKGIEDQELLLDIALNSRYPDVKAEAVKRITDPEVRQKLLTERMKNSESSLRM